MKELFIGTISASAGLTWFGFLIYFTNASYSHPGGWQFFLGSSLTLITVAGIAVLQTKDKGSYNG